MRLVIILSVAGAATVMLGAILVVLGTAMRLVTKHPAGGVTRLGLDVGAAGIAFGLIVLVIFAFTRGGPARRTEELPPSARRKSASRQPSARAHVLKPTSVYTTGGLLDMPGEA